MPENITRSILYERKLLHVAIIPQLRKNGMHYEINIKGYPRFYMKWSALGRYDALDAEALKLPYQLVLAVSDVLEKEWPV